MNRYVLLFAIALPACGPHGSILMAAAPPGAADPVLATVNGQPVPLSRLRGGETPPASGEAGPALERMIGVELAVQEGYRMGLEESLEVRDQMGIFERDTLRDGLFGARVATLRPDPAQVEPMARAMTTQVRIRSALFDSEVDAGRLLLRAAKGDDFDSAAKEIAAEGKGRVDPGEGFILMSELLPSVQAAIDPLSPGRVSTVYRIGDRFAVTRLLERKVTPDPGARARAEEEVLRRMQLEAMSAYVQDLKKKYAGVDEALFARLDFDAPDPGFDSYLKDGRPLVTIAGGEPITVRDLADAVRKRLFHGADRAAEMKRLNRKKHEVLDDLIAKRVVLKEAVARGLDRKPEYRALRAERERELVFGAFVARVIEPEVKVSDDEVAKYYQAHRKDLTAPDMARLESIAFGSRAQAEAALAKLRTGADMGWMRANAPGRLNPHATEDLLAFPPTPVILGDLPAELRRALSGATDGEYRLYNAPGGVSYVIQMKEMLTGTALPLENVRGRIRAQLTGQKRQKVFDDYVAALRKASEVKILVGPEVLEKLVAAPS